MLLKCMKLSVRQGLKKMSRNIVQINNRFIQDENQRRRYLDEERRKRNRFMGSNFSYATVYPSSL